jgi:putative tricarboxylic transport membrane protein
VIVAVIFGVIGYLMNRFAYPRLPLVIAMFLGSVMEVNYRQSMMIAKGDWTTFFTRPISLVLFLLILLSLGTPLIRYLLAQRSKQQEVEL